MRTNPLRLFGFGVLAVIGCDGRLSTDVNDSSPTPELTTERPVPPPRAPRGGIVGTFDLSFDEVVTAPSDRHPPVLRRPHRPPSADHAFRLDLREESGRIDGVLTPRWGTPCGYWGTIAGNRLELRGCGTSLSRTTDSDQVTDTWSTLEVAIDPYTRQVLGPIEARGSERVQEAEGMLAWNGTLTGKGSLVADRTAPEARLEAASWVGPPEALLPWDPLIVRTSEPVAIQGAREAVTLRTERGVALPLRAIPGHKDGASWAGAVAFESRLADWTLAPQTSAWFASGAPLVDRSGRAAAPAHAPVRFLDVRLAGPTIDFDGDLASVASWGGWALYGGGDGGSSDPRCEQGGCLRIGPMDFSPCSATRSGFAALLPRGPKGTVSIRYRILAQPLADRAPLWSEVFGAQVAALGGETIEQSLDVQALEFAALPSPIDGMGRGMPWTTRQVKVPQGVGPIGFAGFSGKPIAKDCQRPEDSQPVRYEVLVEWVRSD